ncbi:MAG: kelch repeat-containing protein [Steroidobacteraceae bacterium]
MRVAATIGIMLLGGAVGAAAATPPSLPEPVSNNAVAVARVDGREYLVSVLGLGAGRTWRDLRASGYLHELGSDAWVPLPEIPDGRGRLASAAVGIGGSVYVFGGYTVAADGSEKSTPEVFAFDVARRTWRRLADMPTPVDDAVAFVYRDRYVYLVSGWHDVDNVSLVQVYDVSGNRWSTASAWPGTPVFGHAGAIEGEDLLICDGVRVQREPAGGKYASSDECWLGRIDARSPTHIAWRRAPDHPGAARYRMAAFADGGRIVFVGGSTNPYNYDGIGYDGLPSEPSAGLLVFDIRREQWHSAEGPAVMDLRAVAVTSRGVYVIGGMRAGQAVSSTIVAVTKPRNP